MSEANPGVCAVRIAKAERGTGSRRIWSREELESVADLYFGSPDIPIHKRNPDIQRLAARLSRTPRGVEAQLLMFRAMSRDGNYGFNRMSELVRAIWVERSRKASLRMNDGERRQ